jgi:hypothetical protein
MFTPPTEDSHMRLTRIQLTTMVVTASIALAGATTAHASGGSTSGGGGGGTTTTQTAKVDGVKVSKAYTGADLSGGPGYQMLIKASSSDTSATLVAYRPDGSLIGWVQNGGGSQYGGTVMPWQSVYSASITVRSSSGGSITVPTTPFQI